MTAALEAALGIRLLYSPHRPEPPQQAFLWLNREEALYGGAAGGGKSDALLMAALQYVDVPGYAAILFRRTFMDLSLPGALIPRSREWLAGTDALYDATQHRWTFPSSATLSFGYLAAANDRYRYQGAEFQFVGFDELTQLTEADYTYLRSRLRKPSPDEQPDNPLAHVPLRIRGATNPGGRGHTFVKRRFIDKRVSPDDPDDTPEKARRRIFIPAKLDDNPHVDRDSYLSMLDGLNALERARLRDGDWNAEAGDRFYSGAGIDAALAHGAELDRLAAEGKPPPPVGDLLAVGWDWGDRKAFLIGWPLEGGGMWLVRGECAAIRGLEPAAAARRFVAVLGTVPAWLVKDRRGRRGHLTVKTPLELVSDVRYDAAGLESQKTFNATARRIRPGLKATKIPFGNFKREAAAYGRLLLERAAEGHRTRVLAISQEVEELIVEQLRNLATDPDDEELPLKPDAAPGTKRRDVGDEERDEGPDAMIALLAPVARRNRAR